MKNILAISGSLRAKSTNLTIIENIRAMFFGQLNIVIYDGLADLPQFNPDLDTDDPPPEVSAWRQKIREADGVLFVPRNMFLAFLARSKMRLNGRFPRPISCINRQL